MALFPCPVDRVELDGVGLGSIDGRDLLLDPFGNFSFNPEVD